MIRIEICGGIATGKTTLAKLLLKLGPHHPVYEKYRKIPFWEKFYASPAEYEFEKNISFLLAHADAIRDAEKQLKHVVCDFAQFQDLAYASLSRDQGDVPILEQIHERIVRRQSPPTAIIHLVCTVESQMQRIKDRGRIQEQSIPREYLEALSQSILTRLQTAAKRVTSPILQIDTDQINLLKDFDEAKAIAARVGLAIDEPVRLS